MKVKFTTRKEFGRKVQKLLEAGYIVEKKEDNKIILKSKAKKEIITVECEEEKKVNKKANDVKKVNKVKKATITDKTKFNNIAKRLEQDGYSKKINNLVNNEKQIAYFVNEKTNEKVKIVYDKNYNPYDKIKSNVKSDFKPEVKNTTEKSEEKVECEEIIKKIAENDKIEDTVPMEPVKTGIEINVKIGNVERIYNMKKDGKDVVNHNANLEYTSIIGKAKAIKNKFRNASLFQKARLLKNMDLNLYEMYAEYDAQHGTKKAESYYNTVSTTGLKGKIFEKLGIYKDYEIKNENEKDDIKYDIKKAKNKESKKVAKYFDKIARKQQKMMNVKVKSKAIDSEKTFIRKIALGLGVLASTGLFTAVYKYNKLDTRVYDTEKTEENNKDESENENSKEENVIGIGSKAKLEDEMYYEGSDCTGKHGTMKDKENKEVELTLISVYQDGKEVENTAEKNLEQVEKEFEGKNVEYKGHIKGYIDNTESDFGWINITPELKAKFAENEEKQKDIENEDKVANIKNNINEEKDKKNMEAINKILGWDQKVVYDKIENTRKQNQEAQKDAEDKKNLANTKENIKFQNEIKEEKNKATEEFKNKYKINPLDMNKTNEKISPKGPVKTAEKTNEGQER